VKPLAVAIMGPTASGKTAAALAIARAIPAEIISVDSALVYREMDIGTAKPTAEELASAPHHLIDIIDPTEAYSVAQFRAATLRLVEEISARGDLHPAMPSMRCVGYRQAWEYLDGSIDRAGLRETGIIATRQLAKRQLTWLRAMPERIVIDCLADNTAGTMLERIAAHKTE
jgi:tRNA A37 N6-isopentenylltransferase MiaA